MRIYLIFMVLVLLRKKDESVYLIQYTIPFFISNL